MKKRILPFLLLGLCFTGCASTFDADTSYPDVSGNDYIIEEEFVETPAPVIDNLEDLKSAMPHNFSTMYVKNDYNVLLARGEKGIYINIHAIDNSFDYQVYVFGYDVYTISDGIYTHAMNKSSVNMAEAISRADMSVVHLENIIGLSVSEDENYYIFDTEHINNQMVTYYVSKDTDTIKMMVTDDTTIYVNEVNNTLFDIEDMYWMESDLNTALETMTAAFSYIK